MRKMKSLICSLTAYMLFLTALPASSVDATTKHREIVYLENGLSYVLESQELFPGIMVKTNGTLLTEETLEFIAGYTGIQTWEQFTFDYPWGTHVTNITGDENSYMIHIDSADSTELSSLGRKLMLEQDCIAEVNLVDCIFYGRTELLHKLRITMVDSNETLDAAKIPELENYDIWYDSLANRYECEAPSELIAELNEKGMSRSEKHEYYQDLADTLLEKYGDILDTVSLEVADLDDVGVTENNAASIWQTAGDPNSDGAVDAQDAAALLETAAQAGTGTEITVTSAADVNADGAVGADDAAAVLTYAAANGSGNPLSWVEVLRK